MIWCAWTLASPRCGPEQVIRSSTGSTSVIDSVSAAIAASFVCSGAWLSFASSRETFGGRFADSGR